MIEIKHLKTLQALRNSGSLAGAAAALHQTQSALSHQFSDLEQRLGFRLFVRKSQQLYSVADAGAGEFPRPLATCGGRRPFRRHLRPTACAAAG